MNKKVFAGLICIMFVLAIALPFAAAAFTPNNNLKSSKFAVAQWNVMTGNPPTRSHVINALVYMDNNEKNGMMVVTIKHSSGAVSTASGPVEFKWSMDHVTAEAKLTFTSTVTMFSGDHTVDISWNTTGATSHNAIVPSANGLTANLNNCNWKAGSAQMILDPDATTGHHQDNTYSTNWAYIAKGDATITITV